MAIPQMALILFPFRLGMLMMTWPSFFSDLATAGHCSSSPAVPLMALPDFSFASVIPLMTWCRPPTASTPSRHELYSASVIPLVTGRPFLLVTFLLAASS